MVTQLDYISYVVFDGKILFASVFILTLPSIVPSFGNSTVISSVILGAITAYCLVTFQNCDLVYPIIAICSVLHRPISHIKALITRGK